MVKKSTEASKTDVTPMNVEAVKGAIAEGKALIDHGKTKVEAAMAIYKQIEGESQETIVKAFIEGASLTEKGALTYWYNCRRKMNKMRLIESANDQPPQQ